MKIQIKNGHLVDPKNNLDGKHDVFIAAGRIAAIDRKPDGFAANHVIDAEGLIVAPGLVDLAVDLRHAALRLD